jgi:S1-C subfamily serine protease
MAVAALWLLARVRFPERPLTANPVPSVLSQLASGPKYDGLAAEIAQLHARLQPSLLTLDAPPTLPDSLQGSTRATAIRLRDDLAVMFVPRVSNREIWNDATLLVRDAASGLAVVRVPIPISASPPAPWTPRQLLQSRYLVASDASPGGSSLRPVFVGSLNPVDTPLWSEPVWAVPEQTDLTAGSFLFTDSAELAGLVIAYGGRLLVVPGGTVLAEAERLLTTPPAPTGAIGLEVQDLTTSLAAVTGTRAGVVVTWVDDDGAARKQLMAGDVIEAIDGQTLATRQHWDVRVARLSAGQNLKLRVRRRGEVHDLALVASAPAPQPAIRSLGLTLRARTRLGAEVVRVDPGSAADRAGLAFGDVLTRIADVSAPTPAQVTRSYNSLTRGARVLVAITRGETHFVTTLER